MTYNKVAAAKFLFDLDSNANSWTFQTFDDNADRKAGALANTLNGTLDERWESLCSLSQDGAGVFVTVNETDGKGRTNENIIRVRALFVDTDGADMEPILKHEPDILVETSPGNFHAYWRVDGMPLDGFRDAQPRLIAAFGTDKNVHDLSRCCGCLASRTRRCPGRRA
jgi:putative DNA primase/helicase